MTSMISEGVEVSVETFYQPDYSNPLQSEFMFAYRITIENHNSFPIKLHRRHWNISVNNSAKKGNIHQSFVALTQSIAIPFSRFSFHERSCNQLTTFLKNDYLPSNNS